MQFLQTGKPIRNLGLEGYVVVSLAIFDMFPYTSHVETWIADSDVRLYRLTGQHGSPIYHILKDMLCKIQIYSIVNIILQNCIKLHYIHIYFDDYILFCTNSMYVRRETLDFTEECAVRVRRLEEALQPQADPAEWRRWRKLILIAMLSTLGRSDLNSFRKVT